MTSRNILTSSAHHFLFLILAENIPPSRHQRQSEQLGTDAPPKQTASHSVHVLHSQAEDQNRRSQKTVFSLEAQNWQKLFCSHKKGKLSTFGFWTLWGQNRGEMFVTIGFEQHVCIQRCRFVFVWQLCVQAKLNIN